LAFSDIAPFEIVHAVVERREETAATDRRLRNRKARLLAKPLRQLLEEPERDAAAFGGVYEAEIEEVREEQLPILVHVVEESLPVDLVALPQDDVGDVRAVVFVPVLDEGLGPHELGRREDADLAAVDLCGARVREPGIVDGRNGGRGIEDDVEEL